MRAGLSGAASWTEGSSGHHGSQRAGVRRAVLRCGRHRQRHSVAAPLLVLLLQPLLEPGYLLLLVLADAPYARLPPPHQQIFRVQHIRHL